MKTIERFGAFVLNNLLLWAGIFALLFWVIYVLNGPKTVTLDSKAWRCVMAVPDGLSTRCTEYVSKEVIK